MPIKSGDVIQIDRIARYGVVPIKCSDQMPQPNEPVLIFDGGWSVAWYVPEHDYVKARWDGGWWEEKDLSKISHWLPLPADPR